MRDLFSDDPDPAVNGRVDQFHLLRLEVFNWGTFAGLHRIDLSPEGHLFTGKSGSGKSTLLDAHAALTTPPKWREYNVAAAQEGERRSGDRNDMTYLRGAWTQQTAEDGEYAAQYLRPGSTWSALCEVFRNGHGQTVTLGMLLWIKGQSCSAADLSRRWFCLAREFTLEELAFFPQVEFDLRQCRLKLPDCEFYSEFSAYRDVFCHRLDLENERPLKLLHKTQSAKNLGDLNTFLRDFMLDEPETFDIKARLVEEFHALKSTHLAVVKARQQIALLEGAEAQAALSQDCQVRMLECRAARDALPAWLDVRQAELYRRRLDEARQRESLARHELAGLESRVADCQERLRLLESSREDAGGRQIARWDDEIQRMGEARDRAMKKLPQFRERCQNLGRPEPQDYGAFQEFQAWLKSETLAEGGRAKERQEQLEAARAQTYQAGQVFQELRQTVLDLARRRSNIPEKLQVIRDRMLADLAIEAGDLPFAGELMEVRPDEAAWQGAIERVLGSFGLSMLVPERHYRAVREYLDSRHLGLRLVYLVTRPHHRANDEPVAASIVHKVRLQAGAFQQWIKDELLERFDYHCVGSANELADHARAVTQAGQVRHSHTRHEKNDLHRIDDRSTWVLGFDNRAKRELLEARAAAEGQRLAGLQSHLSSLEDADREARQRQEDRAVLATLEWEDIDVAGCVGRIAGLTQQKADFLADNRQLADLQARIELARQEQRDLNEQQGKLHQRIGDAEREARDCTTQLHLIETRGLVEPAGTAAMTIAAALAAQRLDPASHETLVHAHGRLLHLFNQQAEDLFRKEQAARAAMVKVYEDYLRQWPEDTGDLLASYDCRDEFRARLERLKDDGLPAYEKKFLEMLHDQSDKNLMMLASKLDEERKGIRGRLESVNESLAQVFFNPVHKTRLVIEVKDRSLPDVREFRQRLKAAQSHSFSQDLADAEEGFARLDALVADLGSQTPERQRWQKQVLDVRFHVEFVAREFDQSGQELSVYLSGAGKSGGQRQLLSATVLAAALRYQLGGRNRMLPRYCTVVLDEAFDKADSDFTRSALTMFKSLGFQLVLATPGKSLETIQTFIGSVSVITIQDQQRSGIAPIHYIAAERRFDLPSGGDHAG